MSLVAWYPLQGDTLNYGSAVDLNPSAESPLFEDANHSSPLGTSLYTGKLTLSSEQWSKILGNTTSIAMWIYVREDGDYSSGTPFFGTNGMTAPNNRKFTMFHYPAKTALHCSWQNDSSNSTYWSCVHENFFEEGNWTHLAIVQDATKGKISVYRNGRVYEETTVQGLSSMSIKSFAEAPLRNQINYQNTADIRIYNHALSACEVKQIYQTLAVHLSPTSCVGATKNFFDWNSDISSSAEYPGQTGWSGSRSYDGSDNSWLLTATGGWRYFYWAVPTSLVGKTVTFSFDYNIVDSTNMSTGYDKLKVYDTTTPGYGGSTNKELSVNQKGQWVHDFLKVSSCKEYIGFLVRGTDGTGKNYSVKVRNLKMANNDWDTVYSPYGELNLDYANGGFAPLRFAGDTTPTPTNSTPVGSVGLNFASGQRLLFENWNKYFPANPFTIAFWVNPSANGTRNIYLGGYPDGTVLNIERTAENYLRVYYNNSSPNWVSKLKIEANQWTHVAITKDASGTVTCYKNGEQIDSNSDSKFAAKPVAGNENWGIGSDFRSGWNDVQFVGDLADFRIYGTCLDADDVKGLATVAARFSDKGDIFAVEFDETSGKFGLEATHKVDTTGSFYEGNSLMRIQTASVLDGPPIYLREIIEI